MAENWEDMEGTLRVGAVEGALRGSVEETNSHIVPPDAFVTRVLNSRSFFDAAAKIVTKEVYIPLVKGSVIVAALTAFDVQKIREDTTTTRGGRIVPRQDRDFSTMVFFYAARNPDGSQLFPERSMIERLHKVNYSAIQPGAKEALTLSGLDDEAAEFERKKHFEGGGQDE